MLRIIAFTMLMLVSSVTFSAHPAFKDGLKSYLKGETEKALLIWRKLADEGDVQSQKQLGQYYLTDHEHRDYERAIEWYRKAAAQGDKQAAGYLKNARAVYASWKAIAKDIGAEAAYSTITFREHLQEGDDTHCGFIVEVKSRVVLIQTSNQARWFRKADVYRPEDKRCTVGVLTRNGGERSGQAG